MDVVIDAERCWTVAIFKKYAGKFSLSSVELMLSESFIIISPEFSQSFMKLFSLGKLGIHHCLSWRLVTISQLSLQVNN